jgi:hypothetical protein
MWCAVCGAFVQSGDVCTRCGASLPGGQARPAQSRPAQSRPLQPHRQPRPPAPQPAPTSTPPAPTPPPRGRDNGNSDSKRSRRGTLADFFGAQGPAPSGKLPAAPAQPRPAPRRIGWRDRISKPLATRRDEGTQQRPERVPPTRVPPTRVPPIMPEEFELAAPNGEEQPWDERTSSPWDQDYVAAPPSKGARARAQAADAARWEAEADEGWAVVPPTRSPDSDALGGGSHSSARNRGPMVPFEQLSTTSSWRQSQELSAITPAMWARHIVRNVNTTVFNLVLIALLVGILGIPVYIGLQRVGQLTPTTTPHATPVPKHEPTPEVAAGFTGFENASFSFAYPADWTHTSHNDRLDARNVLFSEDFKGAGNNEVLIGTTASVPGDQLQAFLGDVANHQFSQWTLQALTPILHVTYDKEQWLEKNYAVPVLQGKSNVTLEAHVLVANHGTVTYYLIVIDTRSSFASDAGKYSTPMLASFRFQG